MVAAREAAQAAQQLKPACAAESLGFISQRGNSRCAPDEFQISLYRGKRMPKNAIQTGRLQAFTFACVALQAC